MRSRIRSSSSRSGGGDDDDVETAAAAASASADGQEDEEGRRNDDEGRDEDDVVEGDGDDAVTPVSEPLHVSVDYDERGGTGGSSGSRYYGYEDTCRLAVRMGVAAVRYGTTAGGVERFMSSLMSEFGYRGCVFRVTLREIFCSFRRGDPEDIVANDDGAYAQIVTCKDGIDLHRLGLLSELATAVKKQSLTPREASEKLDEIGREPGPYPVALLAASFVAAGASLAVVFQGCWYDVCLGSVCGGLAFGVMSWFESLPREEARQWMPLAASFLSSSIAAAAAKSVETKINVTLVTISGVAVFIPGYSVSLGTSELVSGHLMSGFARLFQGTVTMMWLLTGSWLGRRMVDAVVLLDDDADDPAATIQPDPVSKGWYALFVPLLFLCVCVVLGNSHRDVPWAFLCMVTAYGTSLVASLFMEQNVGTFLSSVAMTVFSNVWGNRMDRPNTLVLVPAFLIKVTGSIGFLGLTKIIEGETSVGLDQFLQMFLTALLIIAGVLAGNTFVPCKIGL